MAQIKITLTKSPPDANQNNVKTVVTWILVNWNSSVVKEDNAAIRGMVNGISLGNCRR